APSKDTRSPASWLPAPSTCSPTPGTPQPRHPPRPGQPRPGNPRRGRLAPGQHEERPAPGHAPGPGELTEHPGPRNTGSWSPPRAGGRMGGGETTPPDSRTDPREASTPANPRPRQAAPVACPDEPADGKASWPAPDS